MHETDITYFQDRVRQERERARRCPDPSLQRIHLNFAEHYEARLRAEPMPAVMLVEA